MTWSPAPTVLDFLVRSSDYIVIAAADDPRNPPHHRQDRAGQDEADRVRIVNIARGGHIDEPALIERFAIGSNRRGACLDVFATEPLKADSPLWDLPNVYIAPHNSNGGGSPGVRTLQRSIFIENLRLFADRQAAQ